jgi:hypothetical protein
VKNRIRKVWEEIDLMHDLIYLEDRLKTSKDVDEGYRLSVVNIFLDCLEAFDRVFRNLRYPQRCNSGLTIFRVRSGVPE